MWKWIIFLLLLSVGIGMLSVKLGLLDTQSNAKRAGLARHEQPMTLGNILDAREMENKSEQQILAELKARDCTIPNEETAIKAALQELYKANFSREFRTAFADFVRTRGTVCEAPAYPGFTYLRTQTYSCGGVTNTVKEYRHDQTGLEFVLIPGGTFMMGSPTSEIDRDSDEVQHQVTLSPYLISKTEVTQAVWERVMGSNPSRFKGNDRPVEQVSWNDCVSFCDKTGLSLPTEAQWEFAARSGTQTVYYWGEAFDLSQCNSASYWAKQVLRNLDEWSQFGFNSKWQSLGAGTTSVGKFPPNAYGLYDIAGNVWEWCSDWYGAYSSSSVTNPTGPTSGAFRVPRGGSWGGAARGLRSAYRGWDDPGYASCDLGFRVLAGRP